MSKWVAGVFPLKKTIASLVTIAFLGTTVGQPWAEASFWGDRRKAQEKFTRTRPGSDSSPLLLASANLGSAFGNAHPIPVAPTPTDLSRLSGPLQQSPLFRSLPHANVSVRDAYLPSTSPRQLVIHIQDVHANLEAQKNIAASLVSLAESSSDRKDKPRLLVGLEGAEGPFFVNALRTFPDKEILNEGADLFLKKDLLTGAEFAALISPRGMDLWGVDDRALYQRHVKSVVDATPLESSFRKTLADLGSRNRALKANEYTDALKAWDKEYESYHGERSSLGSYVRHMAQGMNRGAFPQVAKFLDALDTEEKLDFSRAERERKTLVESLAERLSPQDLAILTERAVAFRAGQMGFGAFHSELISLAGKAGVSLSGAQEFLKYLEYVKRVEGIDRTALLDEIDGQEKAYVARLLTSASPRARNVYGVSRGLVMADKLLRHAMTPNEWEEYVRHGSDVKNIPARLSALESTSPADSTGFASSILIFEEFYKAGVARNQVLVDNLFARMGPGSADGKNPRVAVLVAGGFHTDGMTALIKKRGAAYVTLTPRFEVVNGQDSLDVFRQQKTPLDRLFAGEKLNLVEGLGTAVTALSGGTDRSQQVLAEIPTALAAASTMDAQTLIAWLDQLKKVVPSVRFESATWGKKLGYVVTLTNGRQLFSWSSETPAAEGRHSFKLGNGVVNFMPYTPPLSRRLTSFFAKYKKHAVFATVTSFVSTFLQAVENESLLVSLDATGFIVLLVLGVSLLLIPVMGRELSAQSGRQSGWRMSMEFWVEDHNPFGIFKGITLKKVPALVLALLLQLGAMAPAMAVLSSAAPAPQQTQEARYGLGGIQTLNEIVATAVRESATNVVEKSEPAKEVGTIKVTIEKGMTLSGLYKKLKEAGNIFPGANAAEFIAAVVDFNKLTSAHFIKVGQVLEIPLGSVGPVSAAYQAPSSATAGRELQGTPSRGTEAASRASRATEVSFPASDTPRLVEGESGPAEGVRVQNISDVTALIRESLGVRREVAKAEAARLSAKATHPGVNAVPGVEVGVRADKTGTKPYADLATQLSTEDFVAYTQAQLWADVSDAQLDWMALNGTQQATEALRAYRFISEQRKIKEVTARSLKEVAKIGPPEAKAALSQAEKAAGDEVQLLKKSEREAARTVKNLLGLQAKDSVRVSGRFMAGSEDKNINLYQARLSANQAKIKALSQELGAEGADEMATFFRDVLGISVRASIFNEAGNSPLPQLGLSIHMKALTAAKAKGDQYSARVAMAIELLNLKAANRQLAVESAQDKDHAIQLVQVARGGMVAAKQALRSAEAYLAEQRTAYSSYSGTAGETVQVLEAVQLREESLARILSMQVAEEQARAQYRFAGGAGDPAAGQSTNRPMSSEGVNQLDPSRLFDLAIQNRLGFSNKDIETAASLEDYETLAAKLPLTFRINVTSFKGGSPLGLTVGVLLRDSNAELRGEQAAVSRVRAKILVEAARNQVIKEVVNALLSLHDSQQAKEMVGRAQELQENLTPTTTAHPDYSALVARSATGRARLVDADRNELNAWRNLEAAVGVLPGNAAQSFGEIQGEAHDATYAVQAAKGYYDAGADNAYAAVLQEQIAQLGLKIAANEDQWSDPTIGLALTPSGLFPFIMTPRLADFLTAPFRWIIGAPSLEDYIRSTTALAEGQLEQARQERAYEQGQKKVDAGSAATALKEAAKRVQRTENRRSEGARGFQTAQSQWRQKRLSSDDVVYRQMALVNLEFSYQAALGDYRQALNRVHQFGFTPDPEIAALEAEALPAPAPTDTPVTSDILAAGQAQRVGSVQAGLSYLRMTQGGSTDPRAVLKLMIQGGGGISGLIEGVARVRADRQAEAARAKAASDYVAVSVAYGLLVDMASIAQRNERMARVYWLNVVRPQVEIFFPGNMSDISESRDLANRFANMRDQMEKKREAAHTAVGKTLGTVPPELSPLSLSSLNSRPPRIEWISGVGAIPIESHPAVQSAVAEGTLAKSKDQANTQARFSPTVSFNIETPEKSSPQGVLQVTMNVTPTLPGHFQSSALEAEARAAELEKSEQVRQLEHGLKNLAQEVSEGGEQISALYDSLVSAQENMVAGYAAYEKIGVSESGHVQQQANLALPLQAARAYTAALDRYIRAGADFEQSLARFKALLLVLGQNPGDYLKVTPGDAVASTSIALPPPSKSKEAIKIHFPGLLPGSMSREGFTFEAVYNTSLAPNHPLVKFPTQYVEIDLSTGKKTGRVIYARYTTDAKDPARRTTAFTDRRPYAAGDVQGTVPPSVSVFSAAALRSNPFTPFTLPDATIGWDRVDGWTVQSVNRDGVGRLVVDVVTPDGKRVRDEVIRDGKGVRLKNQGGDVPLTKVSLVTDRSGGKSIQKATEVGGRPIWQGQFTERQELISFVDHRNKTRGRVTGRESLPRGAAVTLPDGGQARLAYGGSVVVVDGVDSQGKPFKSFDVLADNFSSLGSVTNASVLRRDPTKPDVSGKPAMAASYTRLGDRDASELREGEAGVRREGNNVSLTLPAKGPYANLAYRGEDVYVLPTNNGRIPGLAFVSPRGEGLAAEVREGVKASGVKIEDPGTVRETMTYGTPYSNGGVPVDMFNPRGAPIPTSQNVPAPPKDLEALTRPPADVQKDGGTPVKPPKGETRERSEAQPLGETLSWWNSVLNKIRTFFMGDAGAADFEDVRATPKGLLDADNQLLHLNGVNWRGIEYGWNFGDPAQGFSRKTGWVKSELAAMKASGVTAVRIPLLDDGRHLKSDYSNFDQFKGDIQVFLDAAAKQDIHVEFVLFDFLAVARGAFDMSPRSTKNFRDNFLTPFLKEFGRHPALLTIDLINEPEWILHQSAPGGWGDKMEGGRRAVNKENYQGFVASLSGAIKDGELKDKDGKPVAGRVLVTVGTSVKHHETATDPGVRNHLDYYSWHHYDWMGSLTDYMKAIPRDGKPFELGEFATAGTQMTPADYMGDVLSSEGGVGTFAWNWGARVGQKLDDHTTANTAQLRANLKAAAALIKNPPAPSSAVDGAAGASGPVVTGSQEPAGTGVAPAVLSPGTYRIYRVSDGTTYTPMPDGLTVIRSLGDPFDPANESDQRVISVPAGFDFSAPGAFDYLDDPAHAARSLIRGERQPNGLTAVEVHSGAKPMGSNLVRVFYQDQAKNTYTPQPDGTWTLTPLGARAPSLVVNPGEGFRVDASDALARLTSPGNRVGFYMYEPTSQIERKGKYDIPAPAGTYVQRYYALDHTGKNLDSERPVEVRGYIFSETAQSVAIDSSILLAQALRPNLTATAAERVDWDVSTVLAEPMLYQKERLGLTYEEGSVELTLAQKIVVSAKTSYGALLVERVQSAQDADFRERHGLGPTESIPPPLLPLQRDEAERRVDEFLLISAVDLVPAVLARSIGMADKVKASDVREAVGLIRDGNALGSLDDLVARFTLTGSLASNRALFDAMESLITTLSGNLDYQDASQVMQVLYHLNTIPFVGTNEVGKPAVRPTIVGNNTLVQIFQRAEDNSVLLRELFLKRYSDRERATALFSAEGLGVLLYWATNDMVTPVPLVRRADREKTHPVGPPETLIERSEAIDRANRPSLDYFIQRLDTPLFNQFLVRWKGASPSYADFLESATLLTSQMVKNQSVLTPEIMEGILARLANGDHSTVRQEVAELGRTKDDVRGSRGQEALSDMAIIFLWILVPLGLGGLFKRFFRNKGKRVWEDQLSSSDKETPVEVPVRAPAVEVPSGSDMAPLLTDLAKNLATVGGGLAGDFRKGHQALEQGRFFMKRTAGPRVTISSWRLTNFLSMGAGVIIFLAQAYAVSTFGSWDGFTVYLWGLGAVIFLNGFLGNFLSWKLVGVGGLVILAIYGVASGTFAPSDWLGILLGGTLSSKLKWRSPDPETDWIGARILANGIQSLFPKLALWGWTDWKDEKVDPKAPKPSAPRVVFNWVQKQLGIRFIRLAPRGERQEEMVKTLIKSIEKAQERMALLWVDLSPELRDDWKGEVLFQFGAEQEEIPPLALAGGIQGWAEKVESAYAAAFPGRQVPLRANAWIGAYGLLPGKDQARLLQELESTYGGVIAASKNSEFVAFSKYLSNIPTSWLAAYSELGDGARASLRGILDSEVSERGVDRESLQAQVRELSRVWAAPPLGMPDDYVYVESIQVDFFEWIEHSKDWLEFLKGKADTYQIFSRTHYPNYDPQYHDPIFYVRGRNFEVLRRNGGNIYLMPGIHEDYKGYQPVTDADRFAYNGSRRYPAHPIRWFYGGISLAVAGFISQVPLLTAVGVLFLILSVANVWRGGWPAVTHPAPLYNIAYYAQMVADRTRTTRDYMAGTVYPINEYRRALRPYRGIVERYFYREGLSQLSDEDFFIEVWRLTREATLGDLPVYPTLQAFLDDNLGQSARELVRRHQIGAADPAHMSYEEAVREEATDRNNMVNPAIAAHKGLQGPGPTNSSQGNTLRQNQITLGLIAIAFFVLVPVGLSLRLDLFAAIAEGMQGVSTGLFAGVPVVGESLLALTNTLSQFVSLENVEFLVFNGTGISLFGGITFGMGAFALLMVGMAFKIILFFQGFKTNNRLVDLLFGVGLLGVAGALWFFAPLNWFAVVGALFFAFIGTGWILKTALATRYKEELTHEHIERFVPEGLLGEALRGQGFDGEGRPIGVSDAELATVGVTREQFNGWLDQFGARGAWRRLAEREDSFLVQVKSALLGIPNTKRPIHRLRQDDRYNLLKIVYLTNVQGPRRKELINHLLKMYEVPGRLAQLRQRMGGVAVAAQWLDGLAEEVRSIDEAISELGENPSPESVLNVYFEAGQQNGGHFSNEDILNQLSFSDIAELKENKENNESLWPKIILMQTSFGPMAEERLYQLLASADTLWPSIQVDITLDDNDEDGRIGILDSMKEGRLARFADRIVISNHAAHGVNLGVGNINQRHKPMMNSEAVFRLNYRFKKFLGRLPFFQTLVDMEDVFLKEVIDDKMAIWAMRERTLNEQLARREGEESSPGFATRQRWLAASRTAGLAMVVGGVATALLGVGIAFAAPAVVLAGISSGSWVGLGGLVVALAGWVYRRRTAERVTVDSQQWGIRLDSNALENEYTKTLHGLATAAGLGRNWAKNNFNQVRGSVQNIVAARHLENFFTELQTAYLRERDLRSNGDISGAEQVRVGSVLLAERLTAEDRVLYELWAYAQVFPTFKDFRRQVFRIRNMPDVIQTELRQIPINAADRRFSELSHIDYLFWHNTIQIGEDASGFMFLGGTGNTFMWELLGGTDDHAYVRLSRMLWPVREANRKEETERLLFLRILFLIPLPLGVLSVLVPPSLRSQFESARATWASSRTLYKLLNRYVPTGVWDKFNIIEDSERGRRSAFLGLTSHRLVGRDKEVLEDALPRLGSKWLNQRQRWIIQQTFFAIVRFLPVGLMFFGQYLGAGWGFALIGDRAHVIQGLMGMGAGFVFGGLAAYLVGLVIFRWLGRAGIIRNTQFYVNPLAGLSPDRGPGLWRGMVSRVKAYYKFQQISHLAASVPMMMASSVLVTITLLYFLGFFFNVGPVSEYVEGLGSPGLTGFVSMMVVFIQTFFPLIEAVVPTTFWGIIIFLYPPVAMNLMSLVTVMYTSWRDDESIRAAVQTKMTSRVHSFLFLFVSTGMKDAAPFDLPGEETIQREESEILKSLRETKGLNRQILEGFLLHPTDSDSNLVRLNKIIAELQAIARELTSQPDNALDPKKLKIYTKRTRNVIEQHVRPLLAQMDLREENQKQIMDKLLEDQTELEDMALGRLRYGWRTFGSGLLALVAASALIWFGWDYPLWLGAFLLALGSILVFISSLNLIFKYPALEGSVQMRHFVVQAGRSLKMYFYFTFLHPSAWRNFGVAVNSFYKPGANEPFWTRGRDEGLGDLSLWELTPQRRFQIWWAGTSKTILQYSVLPFIILASLPWLTAVQNWRTELEREIGVEQVKTQIVTMVGIPTPKNWASWDRSVTSALHVNPAAFQGWVKAQLEEAELLHRESNDRDAVMEERSRRMLDAALFGVRTYADALSKETDWDNSIEAEKAKRRYEEVVQTVQKVLAGMGQMDRFEQLFPGLPLNPVPILNQYVASDQNQLNPRDVYIKTMASTAARPTPRSTVVELRIPQTDLTDRVVAVDAHLWTTRESNVELRVDQVSHPKDGNLHSSEKERKAQGASAQRLPTGRDSVQTFVFHSYSPGVLAPNYTSEKVNRVEIVAYTRGSEPFEARMRFNQILTRDVADPRINVPLLSVPRTPMGTHTISWLWKSWNRLMGRDVSVEGMVTEQAPWESYGMVALAGLSVPLFIFFQWSPVFVAGIGILWGLLHLGGTFDKDLKPVSGLKALVPSLAKATVAAVAVGLFAVGLDFLLGLSPLAAYLGQMALFEGWGSLSQISLLSNVIIALPLSLFLVGPLFKAVHKTLNTRAVNTARERRDSQVPIPVSKMAEAIHQLKATPADTEAMTRFLTAALDKMPLASLDVSSRMDPLVLRERLGREVPRALHAIDSNVGGRLGVESEPSVSLGRMMAPGVRGNDFSLAVRDYAFALGYQMARSDNPASLVPLLEVAYLTVASRSAEVGVHMNPSGFASAFQLGSTFAQEVVGVRENEAGVFHMGQAELAGRGESQILEQVVAALMANARAVAASRAPSPIELVSSDASVTSDTALFAAVQAYVKKNYPSATMAQLNAQISNETITVRLASNLPIANGLIDSSALFDRIKATHSQVTGLACFTNQPEVWTASGLARIIPVGKVLGEVLERLNAMRATDDNA